MLVQTNTAFTANISHAPVCFPAAPDMSRVAQLVNNDTEEVIAFLAMRPVHTVAMTSFINDNGLESELNRGRFYGYRNAAGMLEGVALIGHTTLVEARSDASLMAFAGIAKNSTTPLHLIMSDGTAAETFWKYYSNHQSQPRLVCTELLFELSFPVFVQDCSWEVRLAQPDELEPIAEAHAEVAFIESGVDPLAKDREGFLKRCLRRIEKNRTFVVFANGKLVFKADIVAETNDVVYLEGIYVAPEFRGQGVGSSCLAELSRQLLERAQFISLLSNVEFTSAHRSFAKAGYKNTDRCTTIFV